MAATSLVMRNGIGVIRISSPPVNALGHAVRAGLVSSLKEAMASCAKGVVIIGSGRTFPAGADITEFSAVGGPKEPGFVAVMSAVENLDVPTLAAIHGTALGGGFELALACRARMALPTAKVGLPEVHLGLLPGAGGTQRLPRLVGAEAALEMMLSGRHVPASEALSLGCLDAIAEGEHLEDETLEMIFKLPSRPTCSITVPAVVGDLFQKARDEAAKTGLLAPLRIVDCVEASSKPFEEGTAVEQAGFAELMASDQSKALQHMFFAERKCAKVPGKGLPVKTVGIVGATKAGREVAAVFLKAKFKVALVDEDAAALSEAESELRATYGGGDNLACGKAMPQCDLTIQVSGVLFRNLVVAGGFRKDGAVDQSIVALRFHDDAKLLEVVRFEDTSDEALATAMAVGKKLGKLAVLVTTDLSQEEGLIGDRIFQQAHGPILEERAMLLMANEGFKVLSEGVALRASDIDVAMTAGGYGIPRHCGGPMHYAHSKGLGYVRDRLKSYKTKGASSPNPAPLLCAMAEDPTAKLEDFAKFTVAP